MIFLFWCFNLLDASSFVFVGLLHLLQRLSTSLYTHKVALICMVRVAIRIGNSRNAPIATEMLWVDWIRWYYVLIDSSDMSEVTTRNCLMTHLMRWKNLLLRIIWHALFIRIEFIDIISMNVVVCSNVMYQRLRCQGIGLEVLTMLLRFPSKRILPLLFVSKSNRSLLFQIL